VCSSDLFIAGDELKSTTAFLWQMQPSLHLFPLRAERAR